MADDGDDTSTHDDTTHLSDLVCLASCGFQERFYVVSQEKIPLNEPDHVEGYVAAKGAGELAAEGELLEVGFPHGFGEIVYECM